MLSDPDSEADVESIWTEIKSCLINFCDSVCVWTKGNCKQERETWWWDETVDSLVKQKRKPCIVFICHHKKCNCIYPSLLKAVLIEIIMSVKKNYYFIY